MHDDLEAIDVSAGPIETTHQGALVSAPGAFLRARERRGAGMAIASLVPGCIRAAFIVASVILAAPSPSHGHVASPDIHVPPESVHTIEDEFPFNRSHHQGRSFGNRRSAYRDAPHLRRDAQSRALGVETPVRTCRTVQSTAVVDGRLATVAQRACTDPSGFSYIAPGSRRVIKYLDE